MFNNRTLWLFVAAATLGVAGCGGDHHPPSFGVTWELTLVGSNQPVSCDAAGTPTVTLVSNGPTQAFHAQFPCAAMNGVTEELPPGPYEVTVTLLNSSMQAVSRNEGSFNVADGITPLGDIAFPIQSMSAAWTITRDSAGVSCQEANAATVRLITQIGNDMPVSYDLPCIDPTTGSTMGSTTAIPIGTYSVEVELLDDSGAVLSTAPAMTVVVDQTHPATLPPLTFTVT